MRSTYGCQQCISLESKIPLQTLCLGWNMETQNENFPHNISKKAKEYFSVPEIDLFASCFTTQLFKYVSWSPDPSVFAISILWHVLKFYYFPFFSLIGANVSKIRNKKTSGIIPYWVTQVWFPVMFSLLQDFSILLFQAILTLPSNRKLFNPQYSKMKLLSSAVRRYHVMQPLIVRPPSFNTFFKRNLQQASFFTKTCRQLGYKFCTKVLTFKRWQWKYWNR